MASSRIVCPECKSVLKPGKPVPDGKKVKCPKCNNLFTTPGLVEEEERPRKSKASAPKAKAGIKKASAEPAPKKRVDDDDDDDGGGIYGYVHEKEREEEDKPQIEYAPDMSIKDLRGPAQALVVQPTNYMILIGGIGCLCDILIICVMFWPMVFQPNLIGHEEFLVQYAKDVNAKSGASDAEKKATNERAKNPPKERKDLKPEEVEALDDMTREKYIERFSILGFFVFMLIYNGITVVGAVKLQNLESRRWAMAACIMTILPFGAAGISGVVGKLFHILFKMLLDDADMGMAYASGMGGLMWIMTIVVGVWSLRTLMSKEVVAGFAYVAD